MVIEHEGVIIYFIFYIEQLNNKNYLIVQKSLLNNKNK